MGAMVIDILPEPWEDVSDCRSCGGIGTVSLMSGECRLHSPWVKCPRCEATFPLTLGTYDEGTPDVRYLPNGDPGYPGDPAEWYCPACGDDCEACENVVEGWPEEVA